MTPVRSSVGKYSCYEVALCGRDLSRADKESLRDFFLACRVPFADLAFTDYRGIFRACYYTRAFRRVTQLRRRFRSFPVKRVRFRVKALGRHDWFDKWKRDYHLRPLGSRFMIVPVWEEKKFKDPRRIPVFLDPGSAFGSGYHETTRLMVCLLETLRWGGASFLDIGTGTGILSIVAAKLGAQKVAAFDYDKPSVTVAKKNFELNGCREGHFFGANLKKLRLQERFPVVGANLLSKTLLENQATIKGRVKSGGQLIVSGIARENLGSFRRGFSQKGFVCRKILRGRKWTALVYCKRHAGR